MKTYNTDMFNLLWAVGPVAVISLLAVVLYLSLYLKNRASEKMLAEG